MHKKIKTSTSRKVFQICNYIFLIGFTLLCIYPFWYIIIYSFSSASNLAGGSPLLLPKGFTFANYQDIFKLSGFFNALVISVLRTVIGTFLSVLACSFLGYAFTKQEIPGRKFFYRFMILTMYVSGGMISTFIVIKSYGLLNTFWVYVIPGIVSAYNVVLIKTFIEQLPASLEESAMLDGAGPLTIFFKIILPLSKPIVATVAVFVAVGQWNSWFDNLIYTRGNPDLTTLQYLLYNYLNEAQRIADQIKNANATTDVGAIMSSISSKGIRMTITVLAALPIFVVYPFMQKYFVKGISIGAVKG